MDHGSYGYYPSHTLIFWVAIMAIVAISALRRFLTDRERQRTLRAAIERGQQIDPVLLSKITTRPQSPGGYRRELQTGGIIMISIGIGLGLMGMNLHTGDGMNPTLGPGILVVVIGIGMLVAAWVQPRSKDGSGPPDAGM